MQKKITETNENGPFNRESGRFIWVKRYMYLVQERIFHPWTECQVGIHSTPLPISVNRLGQVDIPQDRLDVKKQCILECFSGYFFSKFWNYSFFALLLLYLP